METRAYQTLRVEVSQHIATLTLQRPERKNALSPGLVNELCYALDDAKENADVHVVVLAGAAKTFCSGGDLSQMAAPDGPPPLAYRGDFADMLLRFVSLGKPTIAKVEGLCMGGGVGLAAACDFVLAADDAVFATPEIKRGLFPMQIMAVMERVIPRRKLMEMMLLGDKYTAAQAVELGLVTRAIASAELEAEVTSLAAKLAALSPIAMRLGLQALTKHTGRPLAESLPDLRTEFIAVLSTNDAREGLSAFLQKREPVWTGT